MQCQKNKSRGGEVHPTHTLLGGSSARLDRFQGSTVFGRRPSQQCTTRLSHRLSSIHHFSFSDEANKSLVIVGAAPSAHHCIATIDSSVIFYSERPRKISYPPPPRLALCLHPVHAPGLLLLLVFFASQWRSCVWPHFLFQCVQAKAREAGLWNLFLPSASGLSQLDYAFIAEETGRVAFAPEVFNCQAPGETSHTSGSFRAHLELNPGTHGGICECVR